MAPTNNQKSSLAEGHPANDNASNNKNDNDNLSGKESELTTNFASVKNLSPRRNSSNATTIEALVDEQLEHFGIDKKTEFGRALTDLSVRIYGCQSDIDALWRVTFESIASLPQEDKIAHFNAKKFLCFQLAKLLDNVQTPFRKNYQNLGFSNTTMTAKGSYPIFDNVTAIFSATPVIARTATYIYACAEWIEDAFQGKEALLEIYSRLLNPTSLSLANHIVDLEAGPYAGEYLAWNFNSGMAAIDAALSHTLGHTDVLITSRNIYGGSHQLIFDWYAKPSNLKIAVETFDGESAEDFLQCWKRTQEKYREHYKKPYIDTYVYLESPSNPHGYVLDVPGICKLAHQEGLKVILDATVGTPFLCKPLRREDPEERPDYLIHSYTKDLSGSGSVIAGCVIGRNEDMFLPKSMPDWDKTMFWNVYYIKGSFLNADAAFEVLQGLRTLENRMLAKCINTIILAKFLDHHPSISVKANCLESDPNYDIAHDQLFLGLPAPLFTIEIENVPIEAFQRYFDSLEPTFGHMISLGQTNTIVSCPGLTTHSELSEEKRLEAGISIRTIRFALGIENPLDLARHLREASKLTIDPQVSQFSGHFMDDVQLKELIESVYLATHQLYVKTLLEDE